MQRVAEHFSYQLLDRYIDILISLAGGQVGDTRRWIFSKMLALSFLQRGKGERDMVNLNRYGVLAALTIAGVLDWSRVEAQQSAPSQESPEISEVIVTGTRLTSSGFVQPTPTTIIS